MANPFLKQKQEYVETLGESYQANLTRIQLLTLAGSYLKGRFNYPSSRYTPPYPTDYISYFKRSKKKGIAFELSVPEFNKIKYGQCAYCGMNSFTIDRIDSNKGYTKDNIQPCCKVCNHMKYIFTEEVFLSQIKRIYDYKLLSLQDYRATHKDKVEQVADEVYNTVLKALMDGKGMTEALEMTNISKASFYKKMPQEKIQALQEAMRSNRLRKVA